jgi:hemolysin III
LFLRDPVASASHLFSAACAIYVTLLLWQLTRSRRERRFSVMLFGVWMVILYSASGIYHALKIPEESLQWFRHLDRSAIYGLIAGTYTPIISILLTGRFRLFLLTLMWMLAFAGMICEWFVEKPPYTVVVAIYLGVGSLGLLGVPGYYRALGWSRLKWGLLGGLFYAIGGVSDMLRWPILWPGVFQSHEMLHFCDMAGTCCHIYFITRFVIPYQHSEERRLSSQKSDVGNGTGANREIFMKIL